MYNRLRYILLVMLMCFSAGVTLAQTQNIPGYPNNTIRRNNFNTDTATNKPGKQLSFVSYGVTKGYYEFLS